LTSKKVEPTTDHQQKTLSTVLYTFLILTLLPQLPEKPAFKSDEAHAAKPDVGIRVRRTVVQIQVEQTRIRTVVPIAPPKGGTTRTTNSASSLTSLQIPRSGKSTHQHSPFRENEDGEQHKR
jgi:hypothetical protein